MGWLVKTLAFLAAIMLFGVGAWQISLLIFGVLLIPPILKLRRTKKTTQENGKARGKFPFRYTIGGLLLLLAFVGYLEHGAFSPLVLGSLGVLVLAWGRIPISVLASGLRPVEDSILLKSWPLPSFWVAIAEVKPLTRDVGRALAGVTGTVMISTSETPSIYLVVEKLAPTERAAENAIVEALRDTALSLSTLGAYLLPLDSKRAVALLQPPLEGSAAEASWSNALVAGTYDLISIRQEKGFARSLGLYRKVGRGREGVGRIPHPSRDFAHPPFLIEVFKAVGGRLTWPDPDQFTAFLSSLLATRSEPVGTRILDAGAASQAQMVVVKSQGSPPVELSRAQLRAVVRMYDRRLR